MIDRAYCDGKTARQIGLENTIEDLEAARDMLLPEDLRKEWQAFPQQKELLNVLDKELNDDYFEGKGKKSADKRMAAVIHGALLIARAKKILTENMLTLTEYAITNDRPIILVRQKCLRGYMLGAVNIGRDWMIPKDSPYMDFRSLEWTDEKKALRSNLGNIRTKKEYYLSRTPRQVGYECPEEQITRDINEMLPERLRKRHILFANVNAIIKRLDVIQTPKTFEKVIEKKNLINISPQEMALACTMHCAMAVIEANKALFYNMTTIAQYAKTIGKKPDIVRQKCLRGGINGATKMGTVWYVPAKQAYKRKKSKK